MTLIASMFLILLLRRMLARYRWDAILHPGTWFSVTWLMAIAAYLMIEAFGGVPVYNPEVLDDLMVMLVGAAIIFWFCTFLPIRDQRVRQDDLQVSAGLPMPYTAFSLLGLAGATINWLVLGANFGYNDEIRQQWLNQIPPITAMMWYLYLLSFPAAFVAGKTAATRAAIGVPFRTRFVLRLLVPLVSGFVWSLGTGGRQALGLMLLHFIVGGAFGVGWTVRCGHQIPHRKAFHIGIGILGFFLAFALFVGLTGLSRAKQQGTEASSFDDVWYLAPVGQMISYVGLTIATHQAYGQPVRRDLSETGPVSLAGFQYFGLRFLTGWRPVNAEDTNPERLLAASGQELASGTRNVFYDLQADFGFAGAFFVIAILIGVSQLLFSRTRYLGRPHILRAAPLVMGIMFWGYSHQFSLLMHNTFFWLVISFGLWGGGESLHTRFRENAVEARF